MAVIVSKGVVVPAVPTAGKMLGDYAHGDIVYLNESGSPVEFYVAKHDYESDLNGAGRTLLVRKDCYDQSQYGSNNAFVGSSMDGFLNSTYKVKLDAAVQTAIGSTTFYYAPGNGNYTITTLARAVFILSLAELGLSYGSNATTEGTALPIASTLRVAYYNGSTSYQWTRTPGTNGSEYQAFVTAGGAAASGFSYDYYSSYGRRPCFTLPATERFNPDTNRFEGVS